MGRNLTRILHWIVTADATSAILYSCDQIRGHWQVSRQWTLQGRADEPGTQDSTAPRFARLVANWLADATMVLPIDRISVFAAAKVLESLRSELINLSELADFIEAELTGVELHELPIHPAVQGVLAIVENTKRYCR